MSNTEAHSSSKKCNFQFQSCLLELTSIISADMSTTEMLIVH